MASPRPPSRECDCVEEFDLEEDETLLRCAHFNEWRLVLIESACVGEPTMWSIQHNVPIWGELYTLDKQEAEEGFAFAEARFHEAGA